MTDKLEGPQRLGRLDQEFTFVSDTELPVDSGPLV